MGIMKILSSADGVASFARNFAQVLSFFFVVTHCFCYGPCTVYVQFVFTRFSTRCTRREANMLRDLCKSFGTLFRSCCIFVQPNIGYILLYTFKSRRNSFFVLDLFLDKRGLCICRLFNTTYLILDYNFFLMLSGYVIHNYNPLSLVGKLALKCSWRTISRKC